MKVNCRKFIFVLVLMMQVITFEDIVCYAATAIEVIDITKNVNEEKRVDAGWVKDGTDWYHFREDGVMDKDIWILYSKDNRIYRIGHDGKMKRGWFADPDTSIQYYLDETEDGGFVVMDNMNSTYDETKKRLLEVINNGRRELGEEPIPIDNGN